MNITAETGKLFRRIHDQFLMGPQINLGIDYSTGEAREDLPEYYEQVELNIWDSESCSMRIVAPLNLVSTYPQLLFDLTVVRKLQLEQSGNNVLIYCNYIAPEHQALIDGSNGVIYVENRFE